jgi:cation transport regulator ChaC
VTAASRNDGLLWYFAYGSNLDPQTFVGRRRMRPLATRAAVLPGWRLVFDLPVGRGERGVANLLAAADERAVGVAYQITVDQARHLDRSEGVPRAYRREAVEVAALDGELLAAFTYVSPHRHRGRKPSRRYLGLLLRGARHHGLPDFHVEFLRSIEVAVDERQAQLELFDGRSGNGGDT